MLKLARLELSSFFMQLVIGFVFAWRDIILIVSFVRAKLDDFFSGGDIVVHIVISTGMMEFMISLIRCDLASFGRRNEVNRIYHMVKLSAICSPNEVGARYDQHQSYELVSYGQADLEVAPRSGTALDPYLYKQVHFL